jgi:adenylate cyclase
MSQQPSDLVALNADVVGYSRLIADDLAATTKVMDEYRELVEARVGANQGTLVNFVGDNFMAVFDDAMDAMRTAISITTEIEARSGARATASRVRFRMGLDQGGVAVSGGDYFGDALNIAARIQSIARAGGISVSDRVYRALDEPALRFRPTGRQHLKNIPEAVEVYEFVDLPSDEAASPSRRPLALESPVVAVLPIHAERVDETVRASADIVRADLIHRLARVPQLKVIDARSEPAEASASEPARYMLETGVHQSGDHVRIYAEVLDVTSINVVKTFKWSTRTADLFDMSDAIADEVGRALEVDLVVGEPAGLYADLDDPEAIEQVYLGWYQFTTGTPEGWARALEHFGRVAQTHPERPYGHVLSAFANWMGASSGWSRDPQATLRRAREHLQAGLAVGDQTGMAHMVEAAILMSERRGTEALELIESAEIERPTCDATFGVAASVRRYLGQWEQAIDLTDTAMRLTGVNKPWYPTVQACSLLLSGRVERAASLAETVLEHQPQNLEALLVLTAAQVELGLDRRARATAALIRERYPTVDVAAWLEANPYQTPDLVDRWRDDLATAGLIPTG